MKNFVKAMDKTDQAFKYLTSKFPRLSNAKIKEGVFIGPQIRELLRDIEFDSAQPVWQGEGCVGSIQVSDNKISWEQKGRELQGVGRKPH